jgi:hypothetical protein
MLNRFILPILLALYAASLFFVSFDVSTFNSPDENANHVTASLMADFTRPGISEPLNLLAEGIVVPRSMVALGPEIVHGSFPGLPLLASVFGMVSESFIPLATIALVVVSVALMYIAMRRHYGDRVALIAASLYALHPAMWYYAARPMMHNAGFVALLVIGIATFILSKKWWHILLAGVALGAALCFRSYAIVWLAAPALAFFVYQIAKKRYQIIFALIGLIIGLMPLLAYNQLLFGGPLETGYTAAYDFKSTLAVESPVIQVDKDSSVLSTFLPFGFHERVLLRNAWYYGFLLYPWAQGLIIAGLIAALLTFKKLQNGERWLLAFAVYAWCVLILIYGSWVIHDNPDPSAITLANSYARYWLPAMVASTPFAALILERILKNKVAVALTILAYTGLSGTLVFSGEDGLITMRQNLKMTEIIREQIIGATDEDAVIITEYADKYLFPQRSVLVPLRSPQTYAAVPILMSEAPLYYFGITLPPADEAHLNDVILSGVADVNPLFEIQGQTLYEFLEK